jgi:hypothetical protein
LSGVLAYRRDAVIDVASGNDVAAGFLATINGTQAELISCSQ